MFVKNRKGMANSLDPDQTAPGLHYMHNLFVRKLWIITAGSQESLLQDQIRTNPKLIQENTLTAGSSVANIVNDVPFNACIYL